MRRPFGSTPRLLGSAAVTALAALAAATLVAAPAGAAPTTGTITGVVTAGGRPLQGVTVEAGVVIYQAFNYQFAVDVATTTRADGSYTLAGVPAGTEERVQFLAGQAVGGTSATGYADRCFGRGGNCAFSGRELTIGAGHTTSGVDANLAPAARIRGRLVDAFGRGVGGMPVLLYAHPNPDQADDGDFPTATTTSDVNGNYVIPGGLYAQTWGLCFNSPYRLLTGAPARDGYVNRCLAVAVSPGQVRSLSTVLVAGGGVSGSVVDTAGQPIAGATVEGVQRPFNPTATTRADGTFRVGHLLPGTAEMCVSAPRFTTDCTTTADVRSFRTTDLGTIVLQRAT